MSYFDSNEYNPAEPNMELVVNGDGINVRSGSGLEPSYRS